MQGGGNTVGYWRSALALLGLVVSAQSPPEPTLRITVNLVQVDAVVTDGRGRHVPDLTRDDFVILQDGKPRKVTHCTYFAEPPEAALPARTSLAATPPHRSRTRRVVALVVDDLGMSFSSAHHAREALQKFVDEQMQHGDLVSIVRTGANMGSIQQFTADKQLLRAAIERVRWNGTGRAGPSMLDDVDPGSADFGAILDNAVFQHEASSLGSVGGLNWVVKGLQGMPGRKSVVFLSDGFRIWTLRKYGDTRNVELFERLFSQLRKLTDLANRAGVVIYTVDLRGLHVPGTKASQSGGPGSAGLGAFADNWDGLHFLARETGGLFTKNDNDIPGALRAAAEDQSGYYLLGYSPDADTFKLDRGESKYHRVVVKVARAGLQVRSRAGFLGTADVAAPATAEGGSRQLLSSLVSPFQSGGVRLHLAALFGNAADSGSYVHAMVHIDGRGLTFVDDGVGFRKSEVDLALAAFDAEGAVKGSLEKHYTIRLPAAALDEAAKAGFLYRAMLPMKKPGAYQFRVGVRDAASEKVGSASQFVRVPDVANGRLALSGISLDSRLEAAGGEPGAPAREAPGGPALRIFRPGEPIYCGVVVYNPAGGKGTPPPDVQVGVRVLRDGSEVWRGEPYSLKIDGQADSRWVPFVQKLSFGPRTRLGSYMIQVYATSKASPGKRSIVTQWTDFELVAAR
jgi:VWFA-related protein